MAACDLPSDPEPEEPGTPVTPAQYEEVLGTDVFDAAPDATVSFRHQTYADLSLPKTSFSLVKWRAGTRG